MASFYSSEGDMLPSTYLLNQKLNSYHPSTQLDDDNSNSNSNSNNKVYLSHPSVPFSYQDLLSSGPLSAHPGSDAHMLSKESLHSHGSEPIRQNYGLSLALGCEEPLHSDLNPYTNTSLGSLLSSDVHSELNLCPSNGLKNVQYLSFDLSGRSQENFVPYLHQAPEFSGAICSSKYLKAAQDLLVELVSVPTPPKQSEKVHNFVPDGSVGAEVKRDNGMSAEIPEPVVKNSRDLSPSERSDLQNKVAKLSDMLDEVNRRYRQYCHQMQVVVSSFDMMAGQGAAQTYTALALRTISCQFGALRNAIKKQIEVVQKSLGEQDGNLGSVLTRLRNMDQLVRQQKALQQFGVMRQPWRPQRGLPETAVTVLRAWLFEHFLHPYPKDSEKIVLARQTGLTRNQVANWFINARVRLWKPMIEDMYKEEFGTAETESKTSPELEMTAQEANAFGNKEDELQDGIHQMQSNELSGQLDGDRTGLSFENVAAFQGW